MQSDWAEEGMQDFYDEPEEVGRRRVDRSEHGVFGRPNQDALKMPQRDRRQAPGICNVAPGVQMVDRVDEFANVF